MNAKSVKFTMTFVIPLDVVKYQRYYKDEDSVLNPVEPKEVISGKEWIALSEEEQELYCLVEPSRHDQDGDYIWNYAEDSSEELVDYTLEEISEMWRKSVED